MFYVLPYAELGTYISKIVSRKSHDYQQQNIKRKRFSCNYLHYVIHAHYDTSFSYYYYLNELILISESLEFLKCNLLLSTH